MTALRTFDERLGRYPSYPPAPFAILVPERECLVRGKVDFIEPPWAPDGPALFVSTAPTDSFVESVEEICRCDKDNGDCASDEKAAFE